MPEKIKLRHPIEWDGKELTEVNLDLEKITGADLVDAEREYLAIGGTPTSLPLSATYQMCIAAKGAGLDLEAVRAMKARDCSALLLRVQGFLLDMGEV